MIRLRVTAVATMIAVALGATAILGGATVAQTPTDAPSPAASSAPCQGPVANPGSMDSSPGSSMSPGMMGHGSGMGEGMMDATATPSLSQAPSTSATSVRIAVTLTDAFRIEPCSMSIRAGVPVTFVVTNSGAIGHEFFLGDEAAQAAHAEEMLSMGGASMHDEPDGIAVAAGETKELTYTFASPGQYLAGCHVPGHYPAGMRAVIAVA